MSGAGLGLNLVETLGWPLLHFVWQGVLIASLCALGCALLRNARPQTRYALACLSLSLCLLWPAYGVWQQIATPASLSLEAAVALLGDNVADSVAASVTEIVLQEESGLAETLHAYLPLIVAGWLLGVLFMLGRMALGWLWLRQIGSGIINPEQRRLALQWQARTSKLAHDFGLQRRVELRVDARLPTPITTGFWRPVIVLPLALLSGMSPALIDALLAHELAHIKRWDYAVNLLQNLVLSLLFYHPAVWWIARRIDLEREQIADDMASSILGKPRDLALALQELDHFQLDQFSLAQAASGKAGGHAGGQLLTRIRRLLRPAAQVWRWHMATPLLGVCMVAGLVLLYQQHAALAAAAQSSVEQLRAFTTLKTHSQHVLVMDEGSGRILLEKNADAAVPVASLSKLMTAMVTLDAGLDMQENITITPADVPSSGFSKSRLTAGVSLPRRAVLDLMLIPSDNSAAKALARTYPGGEAGFQAALQNKVRALQLKHSFFEEASGISVRNTSSASDLHKLAAAAASYPEIARLTTTSESSMQIAGKQVGYQNSNPLIAKTGWDILLAKTGFSRSAGRCLLMRMQVGGRTVSIVLLNAKDSALRDEDVMNIRSMLEQQRPAVLQSSTGPLAML